MLNLQASYFAFENPWRVLERCLHRPRHRASLRLGARDVEICWTARAQRALALRERPLIVELQLYFSCVVKKRVLFHDAADFATSRVNDDIAVAFHPLASAVCDPREFAANYPAGRDLSTGPAARMIPRRVEIDRRAGRWEGRFGY